MVFDPEKITLLVDGSVVTGYADGSSISAERTGDDVTPKNRHPGRHGICLQCGPLRHH